MKLKHKKEDFEARMKMERTAQHDVETRLKALELRMKVQKSNIKGND